jgi:hypothetical protein
MVSRTPGSHLRQSGHTWNELLLDDGTILIVDIMNPAPDFVFPEVGKSDLSGDRTVAGAVKYPVSE